MTKKTPSAISVSRFLRTMGFYPQPTSNRRTREGIRCTSAITRGVVHVSMDFDTPTLRRRMGDAVVEALREGGYELAVDADEQSYFVRVSWPSDGD